MSFSKLQFYGMLRFTFQKRYIHIHPNTCTHSGTDPKTYTHSGTDPNTCTHSGWLTDLSLES